jgi:hypothetical protein
MLLLYSVGNAWSAGKKERLVQGCRAGVSLRETLFHAVVPDRGGGYFGKNREGGSGCLLL